MGYVEGDINNDDKIGLQETIYSLQVAAGLIIPLSGTTINVPGDIPTIQQAIDAASDGDTINIAADTFVEALTISGKALVLKGAGSGSTFIDGGSGTSHVIRIDNSPGVLIENLTVQNGTPIVNTQVFVICKSPLNAILRASWYYKLYASGILYGKSRI